MKSMPFCLAAVTTALWVCISKHPIVYSTTKATKNNSNKTWNEDQEVRFAWMSGTAQGFQGIKTEAGESCSGRAPRIQGTKLPLTSPGHESRSPGGEQGRSPRFGHYQRREPRQLVGMGPVAQACHAEMGISQTGDYLASVPRTMGPAGTASGRPRWRMPWRSTQPWRSRPW